MQIESPQYRYAMLRTALQMFHQPPADLDAALSKKVRQRVNNEMTIGERLLQGAGGSDVVVPDSSVEQAYKSLESEFESPESLDETLAYNGLDRESLYQALRYDLTVEAALERIVRDEAQTSEQEAEIYYLSHSERFTLPETRTVSHILITINDDYAENSHEAASQRIKELREQCYGDGMKLKELAQRHSECPSAMKEGVIGRVKQGQLYPQLDEVLFEMEEGSMSDVIESEIGLHILFCETIHPEERLPFDDVKEKLMQKLEEKKRSVAIKRWLKGE